MAFSGFHFVFGSVGSLAGSLPEGGAMLTRDDATTVAQTLTSAGSTDVQAPASNSGYGDPCASVTATTPGWYAFGTTKAAASAAAASATAVRWYHTGDGSEHSRFVRPMYYAAWVGA